MPPSTSLAPIAEFASTRHGVVTRRQAADLGLERNAIRRLIDRGALFEPAPGVLTIAGAPATWHQRFYVATLAGPDGALGIRASAAQLHGVDGFRRGDRWASGVLHVAVRRGGRVPLDGVHVSQTGDGYPPEDRVVIDHIPCAGLARVVCDLAIVGHEPMVRAFDHLQRRGSSVRWVEQTARRLRGRPGISSVLAEVERRTVDPTVRGSWFEALVEACLASPLIPGLVRQHEIRSASGAFICRVDLAVPAVRLAIEAHSREYHTGPDAEQIDEGRESRAKLEGWEFEYVGWRHVTRTPAQVRHYLEQLVARRALDLGVDLSDTVDRRHP